MKRSQLMKKNKIQRNIIRLNVVTIVLLLIISINLVNNNKKLNSELDNLNTSMTEITNQSKEKERIIEALNTTIVELDLQLKNIENTNKSYVDELTELRKRSELYDKYSYAIIDNGGKRTELKYAEIKLGEELMVEKGYDPDLLFGTIMVESNGNPNAVNKSSGATGYGQFLDSTAKWVWTKLLDNNSYNSEIRKDGESNILMMAEYYDYLYSIRGNTFGVIKHYSGNSTDEGASNYLAKINSYTKKAGAVVN